MVATPLTVGDEVDSGAPILVLESMKMENVLRAPFKARVRECPVAVGSQVETGAPLLVAQFWYADEETMRVRITPPIDVSDGIEPTVQAMADLFAEGIARHPADWHMLQPLWLDDLPAERRARIER